MSASCLRIESTRPILLATLAGSIVSILVSVGAFLWIDAASNPVPVPGAPAAPAVSLTGPVMMPETVLARSTCELAGARTPLETRSTSSRNSTSVPVTRAKERDLRAAFAALERAQPGALEAQAARLLSADGPKAQKVALLRALRDTGSSTTSHWLDVTVRAGVEDADPRSQALQAFALEQLTELALLDTNACRTLGSLAFDAGNVAIDVRRRASAGFATACSKEHLRELSRSISREPDDMVVASALAALESRSSDAQVQRVLMLHQRARPEAMVDETEPSN